MSEKESKVITRDGNQALARCGAIGGALTLWLFLTFMTPPSLCYATFPGTNGKIAFTSNRDGDDEIYFMAVDGTGQTNLTNNPLADNLPALSPDGSKIAFVTNRNGNEEIYVMDPDGSHLTRLTNNTAIDRFPTWSPDGTRIAFASLRNFPWKIYVMDAVDADSDGNGDNLTQLTFNAASDNLPTWSPDGSKIAFVSDRTGFAQIFVMSAVDGSNQTRLTNNAAQNQAPDWSPDGARIAFGSNRSGSYNVYTMDAVDVDSDGNGDNLTQLTFDSAVDTQAPSFSPDGSLISFHSNRDGTYAIYVMNANGTGQSKLTNSAGDDLDPAWATPAVIQVNSDIKPGSFPNSINPKSKGVIPLAILTTATFDATTINPTTVLFGRTGTEAAPVHSALEDVDGDGNTDMILHFKTQATGIMCGEISASLTGETFGGQMIEGADSIKTVGCE